MGNLKFDKKKYMELWREANKDKIKAYGKEYRNNDDNKESLKTKNEEYYKNNKEALKKNAKIKNKEYYKKNRLSVIKKVKSYRKNNKNKRNAHEIERKLIDPVYKLKNTIRLSILSGFKTNGFSKKSNTYKILGCTYNEFKIFIESKFESWMNWGNHGNYNGLPNTTWQLDHKIPISSAQTIEDVIRLNHYTNFQPLCSHVNQNIKRNII